MKTIEFNWIIILQIIATLFQGACLVVGVLDANPTAFALGMIPYAILGLPFIVAGYGNFRIERGG